MDNLEGKLESLAHKQFASDLKRKMNLKGNFCLGYHIRHAFDPNAPSVAVLAAPKRRTASRIRENTLSAGLHTMNHVLDSLYYRRAREESMDVEKLALAISYFPSPELDKAECEHAFDRAAKFREDLGLLDYGEIQGWDFGDYVARLQEKGVLLHGQTSESDWIEDEQPSPTEVFRRLFLGDDPRTSCSRFFSENVCGVQALCSHFRIEPSMVTYRALMAAILQLGLFARSFGRYTVTGMVRPRDPLGFVVGATLLTESPIDSKAFATFRETLLRHFKALKDFGNEREEVASVVREFVSIPRVQFRDGPPVDEQVVARLAEVLSRDTSLDVEKKGRLRNEIEVFLQVAQTFCEEKCEGRSLQFGLLLGQPGLVKYWQGEPPVKCECGSRGRDLTLSELKSQFHLTEGPRHRCLVIPYLDGGVWEDQGLRASTLEFEDFLEGLATWPSTAIWSEEFRPYIYLTERYPWAVAAVVGPRSEMRMFGRGTLQAYRDGKGWLVPNTAPLHESGRYFGTKGESWEDGVGKIYDKLSSEGAKYSRRFFEVLLSLGLQLSPMANRESHGGLLAYAPCDDKKQCTSQITGLDSHDPQTVGKDRHGNQRRWLQEMTLISELEGGEEEWMDPHVASRLVRAGGRDGALVLYGPRGKVMGFGQNLNFYERKEVRRASSKKSGAPSSGTKHAAARRFAEYCHKRSTSLGGGFALAVSSDGPMTLYYANTSAKLFWRQLSD